MVFPPEGISPLKQRKFYTISPSPVKRTGGQKNFPRPAALVFGLAGGMVGRAVPASRRDSAPQYYGTGCDITLRNEVGFVLDLAFVFVRVEHVERVVARGLLDGEHETLSERKDDVAVLVRDEPAAIRRGVVWDKCGVRRTRPVERQQLAVVLAGFSRSASASLRRPYIMIMARPALNDMRRPFSSGTTRNRASVAASGLNVTPVGIASQESR